MKQGIDHGWHGSHGWFLKRGHLIRVHPRNPWFLLPVILVFLPWFPLAFRLRFAAGKFARYCLPAMRYLRSTFLTLLACFFAACSAGHQTQTVKRPAKILSPPIRTAQKWNPLWSFANADDPVPPDWFRPGSPNRRWLWQTRNPLHNFTFYVIGVSDKATTRTGRFPSHVFAPEGGWNWAITKHRWLPLPFFSFDGKRSRFYLGWRESGNFGGKLNFKPRSKSPEPTAKGTVKSP